MMLRSGLVPQIAQEGPLLLSYRNALIEVEDAGTTPVQE